MADEGLAVSNKGPLERASKVSLKGVYETLLGVTRGFDFQVAGQVSDWEAYALAGLKHHTSVMQ